MPTGKSSEKKSRKRRCHKFYTDDIFRLRKRLDFLYWSKAHGNFTYFILAESALFSSLSSGNIEQWWHSGNVPTYKVQVAGSNLLHHVKKKSRKPKIWRHVTSTNPQWVSGFQPISSQREVAYEEVFLLFDASYTFETNYVNCVVTEWHPRESRRYRGRQPKRWEDDLKQVAGPERLRIAKDRNQWKSFVFPQRPPLSKDKLLRGEKNRMLRICFNLERLFIV